jgi:hypothetical protein
MDLACKATAEASPEREYLALLSFLPLKQSRRIPVALVYTWRIAQQLKSARGLIGYTLRTQLLAKSFWTLSACESETAMRAFVSASPHGRLWQGWRPTWARPASINGRSRGRNCRCVGTTRYDVSENQGRRKAAAHRARSGVATKEASVGYFGVVESGAAC